MSLSGALENQNIGGGGFGGWGGFGGIAPIGIIGLNTLFDQNRNKNGNDGDCCEDVKNNARNLAVLQAIQNTTDVTVAEGRATLAAVCDAEKTTLQQFYANAIQNANNTQSIKDQAAAFAVVNDARFDAIERAGVNQTAAILARINDVENQNLRDQLLEVRRGRDVQDIKIENNNTNTQIQAQLQAQAQLQSQREFDNIRRFDTIFGSFNQLNRNTQDVINFGTMAASANQANQQTTIK